MGTYKPYSKPNNQHLYIHKQVKARNQKYYVIYFSPPYSPGVSTREGALFLKIIYICLAKPNPLYKVFNIDTVKVNYKTTLIMKQIVTGHI